MEVAEVGHAEAENGQEDSQVKNKRRPEVERVKVNPQAGEEGSAGGQW